MQHHGASHLAASRRLPRTPAFCFKTPTQGGRCRRRQQLTRAGAKEVWLQTSDKATFQAALESGSVSAFVFGPNTVQQQLAADWSHLARFRALLLDDAGRLREAASGAVVGEVVRVDGPAAARALEARVSRLAKQPPEPQSQAPVQPPVQQPQGQGKDQELSGPASTGGQAAPEGAGEVTGGWSLVLDATDWKVIPAENLVALASAPSVATRTAGGAAPALRLLATVGSATEGRLMLEALQGGTEGVLLRSDDPREVRSLVHYVGCRAAEESSSRRLRYEAARVVAVTALGSGDRACVDLAGMVQPGEGMLVGSFARCLALVASECGQSDYIASRPFRVNAGPVHAYVAAPSGVTRYLSELSSGCEVLLADSAGRTRTALVGRVKIERRPLVLVEFETPYDGGRHSLMLQNAETVKLIGPVPQHAGGGGGVGGGRGGGTRVEGSAGVGGEGAGGVICEGGGGGGAQGGWRTISVAALAAGDEVWVVRQGAARHTGIAIEEFIVEK